MPSATSRPGDRSWVTGTVGRDAVRPAADRATLVGWCIDIADRLQAREPGLGAARLRRGLPEVGVDAQQPDGLPFDAGLFDAVDTQVTCVAVRDRTVASTRLLGYTDCGAVLRHPEVVVHRFDGTDDAR